MDKSITYTFVNNLLVCDFRVFQNRQLDFQVSLKKYPHFLSHITYLKPELQTQTPVQRNQKDLLGYVELVNA